MSEENPKIEMVQCVDATDFPIEVCNWCDEMEIYTHDVCGLYSVSDDGSPLSNWLKEIGFQFKEEGSTSVGIWGT